MMFLLTQGLWSESGNQRPSAREDYSMLPPDHHGQNSLRNLVLWTTGRCAAFYERSADNLEGWAVYA